MNTRQVTEDELHAFVDQALEPERQAEVREYLKDYPEVAQRVAAYERQRDELRSAFAPIAAEPVPAELSIARLLETRRRGGTTVWRAAVAAVLLVLFGGVSGWYVRELSLPPRAGIAALMQEATENYAVFGLDRNRPVELRSADQSELIKWASRRLGHPVAIPDLAPLGYRFMGGRLIATSHGAAVLLMYDDDQGARIVMFSRSMAVDRNSPMKEQSRGSVCGFAWANDGIGYSVVGSLPPGLLHPVADAVRTQLRSSL